MMDEEEIVSRIPSWDDIEFEFNEDTITKTFGQYKKDCMFEIQTIATVKSNGNMNQNPSIKAIKNGQEICLAIDCNFFIFSDNYCELKLSLRTESSIDSFAVIGDFIFIGQSNGELKLIFLPLMQTILSKKMFDAGFKEIVLSHRNILGLYEAVICGADNHILKVININIDELSKALSTNDLTRVWHLCAQMEISNVSSKFTDGFLIKNCTTFTDANQNFLIMLAGSGRALLKLEEGYGLQILDSDVFNGAFLLKAEFSNDGRYIIVLDSGNILHFLCARSLVLLKSWFHIKISTFMFWSTSSSSNRSNYDSITDKLLVLTLESDSFSELLICNFPTLEFVYTTKLSAVSDFVRMSAQQENLFVFEGIRSFQNSMEGECITTIKIKCIQEMQPKAKFSRLLKRKKFKDAELFANLFHLDKEIIYWTQLNCIFQDMIQEKYLALNKESTNELESDLFSCLSHLNHSKQLVEVCRNLVMPSLDLYKKFVNAVQKNADNNDIIVLNDLLYRLQTFQLTFGEENFSSQWQAFSSCNMLNEFIKHFQAGKEWIALNLWLRHENEIVAAADIEILLNIIGENLHTKWFFTTILPSVLKCKPESLANISDWIIKYCKNLELYEKETWPSKALDFVNAALQLIKSFSLNYEFIITNLNLVENCVIELSGFKNVLEDLKELWECYKCLISYSNYIKKDKTGVCCQMLDDVFENFNLKKLISDYLVPLSKRYDMNINDILLEYLKKILLQMCSSSWKQIYINDRILTIFNNISNDEYICQATLAVIFYAEIPWNETVDILVNRSLQTKQDIVAKIQEQIRFADIKKILIPYGLKHFNISNKLLIQQTTQYIAMQDTPTSLSDALKISKLSDHTVEETDIYLFKLQNLTICGSEDDILSLLRILPRQLLHICCQRFVNFIIMMINANRDCNYSENIDEEIKNLKTALMVVRFAAIRNYTDEFETLQEKLRNMIDLKTEFGIHMKFDELESTECCSNVYQEYVKNEFSSGKNNVKLISLVRLGKVMKLNLEVIFEILLHYAIIYKHGSLAVEVLEHFKLDFPFTNGISNKFLHNLCNLLQNTIKSDFSMSVIQQILYTSEELITLSLIHNVQGNKLTIYIIIKNLISFLAQMFSMEATCNMKEGLNDQMYQEFVFLFADCDDSLTDSVMSLITILLQMNEKKDTTNHLELIQLGTSISASLQSKGALSLSFELVSQLNGFLTNEGNMENNIIDSQHLLATLFLNILSRKPLDKQLALAVGICLTSETLSTTLKNAFRGFTYDCEHAEAIANIACFIFKILNLEEEQIYSSLHKRIVWRKKIKDLKIDFDYLGLTEVEAEIDWRNCIREFASNKLIPMEFVIEFCVTFAGCLDEALIYYLECILTETKVNYDPPSNFDENNSQSICNNIIICAENDEDNFLKKHGYLKKIMGEAVSLIEDKVLLLNRLKSAYKKINPYDYEKLLIVLCQIKNLVDNDDLKTADNVQKKIDLLKFLFDYQRVQVPSEQEIVSIEKFGWENGHNRLPFHAFVNKNPWDIITAELHLDTIDIWTCAVPLLQLSRSDDILAIAVRNDVQLILQKMENNQFAKETFLHSKLEKIFSVIKQISDPTLAVSCGNWVTGILPLGQEKVYSAKHTIEIAKYWADIDSEKMGIVLANHSSANVFQTSAKKLTNIFRQISTEVVLMNYNMRSVETLQLLKTPDKLLIHLYEDKNKLNCYKAIEEISEIYKLNREDIELNLVEKWLTINNISSDGKQDSPLEKAICVFRHMPKEESVLYLLNRIIQEETCTNYIYKYRALKCLAAIADPIEIQNYSKNFITDVRRFLLAFYYLSQLESLNFHLTLVSFLNSNKEKLAIAIWNKLKHNSKLVDLISNFCLDYNVKNIKLYEDLLNEMVSQKLVICIEKFMSLRNPIADLCRSKSYNKAWQFILMWPFQNANACEGKMITQDYVQIAINLYRSPVCCHLFLDKLCSEFVNVGLPAVGVGCLFHIAEIDHRSQLLEKFAPENSVKAILDNLVKLQQKAITFPQFSSVVSYVANCPQNGFYKLLLDTPFYELLTAHLINRNCIFGLLKYLSQAERWDDCQQLIDKYCQNYPISKLAQTISGGQNESIQKMIDLLEIA